MATRDLDALFEPKAIALIGARNTAGLIGAALVRYLFEAGFNGRFSRSIREQAVRSTLNYRSAGKLPIPPTSLCWRRRRQPCPDSSPSLRIAAAARPWCPSPVAGAGHHRHHR
jgi:hypothetical protein